MNAQSYCTTDGNTIFGLGIWINRFELGSINNNSGNNNGYADFTSQSAALQAGNSSSFTLVRGGNLFSNNFNARIWIDFNADGDFTDAGELAYQGNGSGTISNTITVPSNATAGNTTMRVAISRFGFPPACGNYYLGETEDYTVAISNPCNVLAGTIKSDGSNVCSVNGVSTISATPSGNAIVPAGYQTIYVLTSGTGLVIEQASATPSFTVTTAGLYTIHTLVYDPSTLDLTIVQFGVITGFDVNGLLVQGGGRICASLDVTGAPINVANPNAGTITPAQFLNCLNNGTATLNGNPQGNSNVPAGYQTVYVLTRGQGLVIQNAGATPSFTVTAPGLYRIHTLVYDPNTLNLNIVVPGVTTGFDVNGLLVQGGGSICASLDVQGAPFIVFGPYICSFFGIANGITAYNPNDESQLVLLEKAAESDGNMTGSSLVFPNPANDYVKIKFDSQTNSSTRITIYNMTGQKVIDNMMQSIAGYNEETIDINKLQSGTYFVKIESGTNLMFSKLSVVK